MNDEKISLRIEATELEKLDAYIARHPEEGSRSLFIKNAIRDRIDRDAEPVAESSGTTANSVTVALPPRIMVYLESQVNDGYELSIEDAVRSIIRDKMTELRVAGHEAGIAAAQRATPGTR